MREPSIQILIVEDNSADAQLMLHELTQAGLNPKAIRVDTESGFLTWLNPNLDAILCDYRLPQFSAMRALELARERCPEVPFFVVSGSIGEEIAVNAIKQGATDYLLKDRLARLGTVVRQAIAQRRLKEAERQAQEALQASEAQYRALAESIPQLVWMARTDGFVEFVNRRSLEYTGLAAQSLTDQGALEVIHYADLPRLAEPWECASQTGEPPDVEFRIRRVDGAYRWHSMRSVAIRDSLGRIVKWLGSCTDIHDHKQAAERLARDALLLASVRDSVIVTDLDGIVTYWNDGATKLFGWTAQEMIGRPYTHRFPAALRAELTRQIQARVDGNEFFGEYQDLRKDGTRIWIHARVDRFFDASGQPAGVLGVAYDITARVQAEEALRLRDRAIQAVSEGILITDASQPSNPIIYASPSFEALTGYTTAEVLGRSCDFLFGAETDPTSIEILQTALRETHACAVEFLNYRKDGKPFWNALSVAPVRDRRRLTHFVWVQTDVSERRRLEKQDRQVQKMEAFGRLAGGVAQDFSNLLTVINGSADLLLEQVPPSDSRWELLAAIREAGQRAASSTAQLLAFSRQTLVEPKVLDVNEVVEQIARLLRRVLGENITLITVLHPKLHRVMADRAQLDQVIMNLSINARDAMPTGGRLTIETKNVELSAADCPSGSEWQPGHYVALQVADLGCGMTEAVKAKLFEPYFTTKELGKHAGLGLATVYGIAKTYGGHIDVVSEVNRGTAVTVYLPATIAAQPADAGSPEAQTKKGSETLLILEDEPAVRRLMRVALELHGYKVLEPKDGADALRIADDYREPIHLFLIDVGMPEMGGRKTAKQLLERHPQARVLYLSGYADDPRVRKGPEAISIFLQKPFTPLALSRKVREILDDVREVPTRG